LELLARLKERRLVQWTLTYLAGAWLLLEVFSMLRDGFGWPDFLFPIVVAAIVLGLPVTVVLAWYHGEQGRQRVSGAELMIIALLLFMSGLLVPRFASSVFPDRVAAAPSDTVLAAAPERDPGSAVRPSIAVLALANLSGREEDEHFVDGMHQEILTQLGKIRSLDVRSLTSVLQYRDGQQDVREIGQALNARFVVEGSVRRQVESVRMSFGLVDARTNERLWSGTYDEEMTVTNVFDVQRQVALDVAATLGADLLPGERALLDVDAPDDLNAYEDYLEGLFHLRAVKAGGALPSDYAASIESLTQAIQAEPEWAPPRAALGVVYHWRAFNEGDDDYRRSMDTLEEALALDPLHAPTWSALAYVRHNWQFDFEGAEDAYRRASELGERDSHGEALLLASWGRFDEAVAEFERAVTHDPLRATQLNRTWVLGCAGQFEESIEGFGVAEVMAGPSELPARSRFHLARAYVGAGRPEDAFTLVDWNGFEHGAMAYLFAGADSVERARFHLSESDRKGQQISGVHVVAALQLEERERALDYLENLSTTPLYVRCFEEIRNLAGDPRYERFLDRVGFPER